MDILIIEDEFITAEELQYEIKTALPQANIVATLETVEDAILFLEKKGSPDLIFSDIQLADGLSFEIYEQIKITCPIIFCTAFDEYAIRAFQNNGIDYVLKPFDSKAIRASLAKFAQFQDYFYHKNTPSVNVFEMEKMSQQLAHLLEQLRPSSRSSFLVHHRGKYFPIGVHEIAFFYTEHENIWLVKMNHEKFYVNYTLDELEKMLNPALFYRLNRQCIIHFQAIKEFEPHLNRKLSVKLKVPTAENFMVSKEKANHFIRWVENH